MSDDFYRIRRLPPYVIAEVNAMRAQARAAGEDIIDLGMGIPFHCVPKECHIHQIVQATLAFRMSSKNIFSVIQHLHQIKFKQNWCLCN